MEALYCPNCFIDQDNEHSQCYACKYKPPAEPDNPTYLRAQGTIHHQYMIGRVLGHGGFGITYLAFDQKLSRRVAIKEYFPSAWASRGGDSKIHPYVGSRGELFKSGKASFIDEARILTQFHSPHIVRVLDLFEALGTAYYVMEYLEGETLEQRIEKKGPMTFEQLNPILESLMGALEEVHSQNVYHRDLKPENVYLTQEKGAILLDFGAARYYSANQSHSLTAVLTPGYAPVEQYFSKGHQGAWTDIYALAATGYYCLTGKRPPEAPARREGQNLIPPSQRQANISEANEHWLLWGLAVDHTQRPQSISQWRVEKLKNSQETDRQAHSELEKLQKELAAERRRTEELQAQIKQTENISEPSKPTPSQNSSSNVSVNSDSNTLKPALIASGCAILLIGFFAFRGGTSNHSSSQSSQVIQNQSTADVSTPVSTPEATPMPENITESNAEQLIQRWMDKKREAMVNLNADPFNEILTGNALKVRTLGVLDRINNPDKYPNKYHDIKLQKMEIRETHIADDGRTGYVLAYIQEENIMTLENSSPQGVFRYDIQKINGAWYINDIKQVSK